MEFSVFTQLSLIVVLATMVAGLMKVLKQPLVIGHLLTGLLVGPLVFDFIQSRESLEVFSELGIALLLFMVGIHLSPRVIKEVGMVSLVTGLGQIVFTSLFGFIIARLFGFDVVTSSYIGIALTLSSTIIILKLLSDKRDLERPYGKIAIGFLIVQDVVAALILIIISAFADGQGVGEVVVDTVLRGAFLAAFMILIGVSILPKLSKFFAHSQELLFLFSIAWGLGLAVLFSSLGFSLEIGALVAGVALSTSPYSVEVAARLRPLRDFFIIIFFILLGAQFVATGLAGLFIPAIVLSLFVLIGNPIIMMFIMGALGYGKRISFFTGVAIAQVSEFSFIIILLATKVGHLSDQILSFVTIIGLITIAGSTYLILYSEKIYKHLAPFLNIFERNKKNVIVVEEKPKYDVILFGLNRIGHDFLGVFRKKKYNMLVVDFSPEVVNWLGHEGIDHSYGDADDTDFLNTLPLDKVSMIVSTIPELETNILLLNHIRSVNKKVVIIVINHAIDETKILYKKGASYVILPHFLGGRYAAQIVDRYGFNTRKFGVERRNHLQDLEVRQGLGHEHPIAEREM